MPRAAIAALACALLALPAAAATASPKAPLLAGAGEADITPPITTPMFAYTARSFIFNPGSDAVTGRGEQVVYDPDTGFYAKTFRASDGIHMPVLSRALVFERNGKRYALAQADLGGLPYELTQEVLRRIADTGITGDRLLLSATHTHSSTGAIWPDTDNAGYAFVGGDSFDPRIFDLTAAGISEAIHQAVAHLEPARVGWASAAHDGASRNRSFEAFQRDKEAQGLSADQQRAISTDPTFTVLRVDATDGRPIAAWSNFAVHPTGFDDDNHLFSGDGAGVAARIASAGMAADWHARGGDFGTHPAPVDVWTNGAQGDISPNGDSNGIDEYDPTEASHVDLAGERDAAGILQAWRAAGQHMSTKLDIGARRELIQFDGSSYGPDGGPTEPVGPFPWLGQGGIVQNDGTCAPANVLGPGQGNKLPTVGGPAIAPSTFPVSFWRLGDLGIAAYPAEITQQMGKRIRDDLQERAGSALGHVAIAGLTNGYISYTTTPEEYDYCGYEGSFTLYGREEGYAWMAFGRQLEGNLLHGTPVTSSAEPTDHGIATAQTTPLRPTADAGTITQQPAAAVGRYGRAVFKWKGGDQQIDPARGRAFVELQRREDDGSWRTVGTDDSFADTTERSSGEWTETWQFDQCTPTGTYRFGVRGVAVKNAGDTPGDYTATSNPFRVDPVALTVPQPTVTGGVASVQPLYPDPGAALLALPRLVRGATVTIELAGGGTVAATDPDGDGTYTAQVGNAQVTGAAAVDGCGNEGRAG